MSTMQNPKLVGSRIIDCIPQRGPCPNNCNQCYYNNRFYTDLEPIVPSAEEAKGKIVRMNSGNDSNVDRQLVIATAEQYEDVFFNTSIPIFDFPGPVVYTANRFEDSDDGILHRARPPKNLMFVRLRVNTTNLERVYYAARWWCGRHIPVVLTFMRYLDVLSISPTERHKYALRKHVYNEWYVLQDRYVKDVLRTLDFDYEPLMHVCGYPSPMCVDCGLCEHFYYVTKRKLTTIK